MMNTFGMSPERRKKSEYVASRLAGLERELAQLPPFDGDGNMHYVRDTMRIHGEMLGLRMCDGLRNAQDIDLLAKMCRNVNILRGVLREDVRYAQRIGLPRDVVLDEENIRWFVGGYYAGVVSVQDHIAMLVQQRADDNATRPIRPEEYLRK